MSVTIQRISTLQLKWRATHTVLFYDEINLYYILSGCVCVWPHFTAIGKNCPVLLRLWRYQRLSITIVFIAN